MTKSYEKPHRRHRPATERVAGRIASGELVERDPGLRKPSLLDLGIKGSDSHIARLEAAMRSNPGGQGVVRRGKPYEGYIQDSGLASAVDDDGNEQVLTHLLFAGETSYGIVAEVDDAHTKAVRAVILPYGPFRKREDVGTNTTPHKLVANADLSTSRTYRFRIGAEVTDGSHQQPSHFDLSLGPRGEIDIVNGPHDEETFVLDASSFNGGTDRRLPLRARRIANSFLKDVRYHTDIWNPGKIE